MNSYEKKVTALDEVIERLETGDISLQEALDLYRQGNELMIDCAKLLQEYQAQAQKMMIQTEEIIQEANRQ